MDKETLKLKKYLGTEPIRGILWDIYRGETGNLVGVCDEKGITVVGGDYNDMVANIDETLELMDE